MSLFKNLFGSQFKDENSNLNEDANDNWADSITTGWEYTCNLFLITPKICLENDGLISEGASKPELFGEPNKFSKDGEPGRKKSCGGRAARYLRRRVGAIPYAAATSDSGREAEGARGKGTKKSGENAIKHKEMYEWEHVSSSYGYFRALWLIFCKIPAFD